MIRARIERDAPGCWAFSIFDADSTGLLVTGNTDTWDDARDAAVGELKLFADPKPTPARFSAVTPGDAKVPRGNRRWRQVLGL